MTGLGGIELIGWLLRAVGWAILLAPLLLLVTVFVVGLIGGGHRYR